MKRLIFLIFFIFASTIIILAQCNQEPASSVKAMRDFTADEQSSVETDNRFGLNLFNGI